ncbi:MAG TPA: hypothetical protein VHV51_19560 [Polyangiaceae bacterium]|nr:hypothetical protein [Polyangiaceae bacterium]
MIGVLAAIPASAWLWSYTVDDALITARVAANIGRGLGQRFNPHGPIVDAVTPLGYAHLLSLFARGDVLSYFHAAKVLGVAAWIGAAAVLGALIARAGETKARFLPLGVVALSTPLAAWAASGMETGIVTLFATLGLIGGAGSALALGLAAAWRPELIPFAFVLVVVRLRVERATLGRALLGSALALLPSLAVATIRSLCFGRAVPLAFYAKPSDFAHGLAYALGGFAFTGLPWLLVLSPRELVRVSPAARPLLAAFAAHCFALVLCGGDWMSFYRLLAPVLPCAALAAAYIAERARPWANAVRMALALLSALLLAWGLGAPARRVGPRRAALIAEARPLFAHDARIAALDVGWVGAASDADVIDLAGVTDEQVAFFPGGHTSKRIPRAWLFAERPTAIVLLVADKTVPADTIAETVFSRAVEERVANFVADDYRIRGRLALGFSTYVVLEPKPNP